MADAAVKIKIAPHSKESEMMVLGCMLTSINGLNIAADALDDSDFYFTEHKIIFQVLKTAYNKGQTSRYSPRCGRTQTTGQANCRRRIGLSDNACTICRHISFYRRICRTYPQKALLRKMIHAAQLVEKSALEEPLDVNAALDDAQQLFFQISQAANPGCRRLDH